MKEIIQYIMANIDSIIAIALAVVGLFSMIATMTPNKADDRIAQFLLDVINFLGANVGKASNEEKGNVIVHDQSGKGST